LDSFGEMQEIYKCDSPGLCDSNGDISNVINTHSILRKANFVRPVVHFDCNPSRIQQTRDLLKSLVKMVPNMEAHADSFSYLYASCTELGIHNRPILLEELYKTRNDLEKADENYSALLKSVWEKAKEGIVVNYPNNASSLFEYLLRPKPIKNPQTAFQIGLPTKSEDVLTSQLKILEISVAKACRRSDYEHAYNGLSEINLIKNHFSLVAGSNSKNTIDVFWVRSKQSTLACLKDKSDDFFTSLERTILSDKINISNNDDDDNTFGEISLKYKQSEASLILKPLLVEDCAIDKKITITNPYEDKLIKAIENFVGSTVQCTLKDIDFLANRLNKMMFLKKKIQFLEPFYIEICKHAESLIEKLIENVETSIKTLNIEAFHNNLTVLILSTKLQPHLNDFSKFNLANIVENKKIKFVNEIKKLVNFSNDTLNEINVNPFKQPFSAEDFTHLNYTSFLMWTITNNHAFSKLFEFDLFSNLSNIHNENLLNTFDRFAIDVKSIVVNENFESIDNMSNNVTEMKKMRENIYFFEQITSMKWTNTMINVKSFVHTIQTRFNQIIRCLQNSKSEACSEIEKSKFSEYYTALQQAAWVDSSFGIDTVNTTVAEVGNFVLEQCEKYIQILEIVSQKSNEVLLINNFLYIDVDEALFFASEISVLKKTISGLDEKIKTIETISINLYKRIENDISGLVINPENDTTTREISMKFGIGSLIEMFVNNSDKLTIKTEFVRNKCNTIKSSLDKAINNDIKNNINQILNNKMNNITWNYGPNDDPKNIDLNEEKVKNVEINK
jgi:hypothetical protein